MLRSGLKRCLPLKRTRLFSPGLPSLTQPSSAPFTSSANVTHWNGLGSGTIPRPGGRRITLDHSIRNNNATLEESQPNHDAITDDPGLTISDEVYRATSSGYGPVVALETTIYTHGFPYPENVDLALGLEKVVRDNGGIPATIGVLNGEIKVGMTSEEIIELASSAGKPGTMKVSRRDIPYITGMGLVGKKLNGGTTIAGTMVIAKRAGISVFGTGGLGGVHRGGENTMDISADLTELGRTGVAVISSGCKAFLDLPRTLEYLETQGVPVCTFADGRTGSIDIPSFYTRESGIKSPLVVQNAKEAAAMIFSQYNFSSSRFSDHAGFSFANPIPEEFSIPKNEIDSAINQAVQEAADQGFHGHANTPFILARIKELTGGNSIIANKALIESNVKMATQVAVELAKFMRERKVNTGKNSKSFFNTYVPRSEESTRISSSSAISNRMNFENNTNFVGVPNVSFPVKGIPSHDAVVASPKDPDLVVFGSLAIDLACDHAPLCDPNNMSLTKDTATSSSELIMHTSNPATTTQTIGGVGHNVALAAHLAGGDDLNVRLCSLVGDDLTGAAALAGMKKEGLDTTGVLTLPNQRTAQYIAINDGKKDLVLAMADMSIISNATPEPSWVSNHIKTAKWAVIDANWNATTIQSLLSSIREASSLNKIKTAFEPVSVPKSGLLFPKANIEKLTVFPNHLVDLATPNLQELAAMYTVAKENGYFDTDEHWKVIDAMGIPSTGARDRFVQITNSSLTNAGVPFQTIQLLPLIPTIITKLGADGVLVTKLLSSSDSFKDPSIAPYILSRNVNGSDTVGGVYMRLYPAVEDVPSEEIVSVNGVGDTFLGVLIALMARGEKSLLESIHVAQKAACMTLRSKESVSPEVKNIGGKRPAGEVAGSKWGL